MTLHQLIRKVREVGYVFLKNDGYTVHVELPRGHEQLKDEVRAKKERIRSILQKQHNAKRKRKAPVLAAEPAQPVYIPVACRCSKYPHPHVHNELELEPHAIKVPGEVALEYLREQARKYGVEGDALPPTHIAPEKKVELSPWGKPKIKGYTKYRWDKEKTQ